MKKIFYIVIKMLLRLFYIINICIMLLSAGFVIEWIIAEKNHDGLALMGLVGMIHGHATIMFIISALIFTIFTKIFIKNRKIKSKNIT